MVTEPLWLTQAKRVYLASLPEKVSVLRTPLAALDGERTAETQRALFDACHRIEGSAASYDWDRLGKIAAECSELLSATRPPSQEDIDALRVRIAQLAEAAELAATASPSPKLRSVLVVDDEPAAQATLQRLLEREGFAVQLAASCA